MKKFETVEDVKNSNAMKAALAVLKRLNRPAEFMFKARCEVLDRDPLLLLASPGTKVDRTLAKALKDGSKTIYGQVRRRGTTLVFSPRGQRPNKKEMVRLIAKVGRQNQVTLPLSRIIVTTQLESRAINAIEASMRRLGRISKPTPFIFNARWEPLRGPAFLLGDGGRDRYFSMLRAGPAVEGTAVKEGRQIVLTIEKGTANPGAMARQLVQIGREIRVSVRRPEIRVGGTATATAEDLSKAPRKGSTPASTAAATTSPSAPPPTPVTAKAPTPAPAPPPQKKEPSPEEKARLAEQKRQEAARRAEAKRKEEAQRAEAKRKAEEARRRKEEEARRAEEARQERERQEKERQERERKAAEMAAEIAKLPKYRKRLARAESDAADAESDLKEASVGLERESALLQRLRKVSEAAALRALFDELQEAIIADSGKPDKGLQKLLRGLPDDDEDDEDELEDAIEEAREFLEERIEEYEDDLGDLRKEATEAIEKRDAIRAKVEALEALS